MAALKGNAAFESFMMNPTVARSAKTAQLESLLDDKTFSFVSKNLFLTMSANGRIADVEKVVEGYAELMEASRGEGWEAVLNLISDENLVKDKNTDLGRFKQILTRLKHQKPLATM